MDSKISDKERALIDVATLEKKIAELQLEVARVNLECSELKYRNKVLNIYLAHGMTTNHIIDAEGNIKLNDQDK